MKVFNSVKKCINYIKSYNKGERTINDLIHFGLTDKPYVYADDVDVVESGINVLPKTNPLFVSVASDDDLSKLLGYLLNKEGVLYIS